MLRVYTGPAFRTWNFFLRYGPGVVLCCTEQPYHEHHSPALVFCSRSPTEPTICMCGKRKDQHSQQQLHAWSTSLAVLYSGITKVGTASTPQTVYRGVNEQRIRLPKSFTDGREGNFAGGVELGAMSTTTDRKVAESYSGDGEGSIFQIKFDAASPGADLRFLSQYPQEAEMGGRSSASVMAATFLPRAQNRQVNSEAVWRQMMAHAQRQMCSFPPAQVQMCTWYAPRRVKHGFVH